MTPTAPPQTAPPQTEAPVWSGRPFTARDRDAVLGFFTEPDFYFRTAQPDTRPEWEVLELLGDDTRVLLADGEPVGLWAWDGIGSDHGCHYQLHLRLHAAAPPQWWRSAFDEAVRALRWRRELVRLAWLAGEFDERGLEVARSLGLTEEGTLGDVTVHEGRRYGYVFFSRIWTPTS
jgi:hypothetical protein